MKACLFFLFLLMVTPVSAQKLFFSSHTQHWPTIFSSEIEEVERTISIGNEEITIISITDKGKDVQTLLVRDIQVNEQDVTYICRSRDGDYPASLVLPLQKIIRHIDLYQVSSKTGEEIQLRFHISHY